MNYTLGQKVWLMMQNRPIEVPVTKIVTEIEIITVNDINEVFERVIAYASLSILNQHEIALNSETVYETKEQMIEELFNSDKTRK